jgi:hypothetical protein
MALGIAAVHLAIAGVAGGCCIATNWRWSNVAQLMVRNVDDALVREFKKRAARRNHSAEQEHREILEQALLCPRRRALAEAGSL